MRALQRVWKWPSTVQPYGANARPGCCWLAIEHPMELCCTPWCMTPSHGCWPAGLQLADNCCNMQRHHVTWNHHSCPCVSHQPVNLHALPCPEDIPLSSTEPVLRAGQWPLPLTAQADQSTPWERMWVSVGNCALHTSLPQSLAKNQRWQNETQPFLKNNRPYHKTDNSQQVLRWGEPRHGAHAPQGPRTSRQGQAGHAAKHGPSPLQQNIWVPASKHTAKRTTIAGWLAAPSTQEDCAEISHGEAVEVVRAAESVEKIALPLRRRKTHPHPA